MCTEGFFELVERLRVELLSGAARAETCELQRRVRSRSRSVTTKINDVALLRTVLERYDFMTPIHADDLSTDNTRIGPEDVARIIAAAECYGSRRAAPD